MPDLDAEDRIVVGDRCHEEVAFLFAAALSTM
jgi:hypothetical protein